MIVLTSEQADQVRGIGRGGAALDPREMVDGNFILPEAVLEDPAHAEWRELLSSLPRRDVSAADFPPPADG